MEQEKKDKILVFDTLFTTNHIQMLKILLCYMDTKTRNTMAVYIKLLELQYTLKLLQNTALPLGGLPYEESLNATKLCEEMMPFCSPPEQEKLQNIKNMYKNFENMQEMMQMMDILKDIMPDNPAEMDFSQLGSIFESFL